MHEVRHTKTQIQKDKNYKYRHGNTHILIYKEQRGRETKLHLKDTKSDTNMAKG